MSYLHTILTANSLFSCIASARAQRHLQGPLDGSLYATIAAKGPRSPPSVILSPPVEFRESTSPLAKPRFSGSTQSLQVYPSTASSSQYHRQHSHDGRQILTPTNQSSRDYSPSLASTVGESVHFQRAYSTPPGQQQHFEEEDRYATINQKTINQQLAHRHPQRSSPQQFVQEIRIIEELFL